MAEKQFAIQAGGLRSAIAFAGTLAERRRTIPILSHLYLRAEGGRLTIVGCNLDAWITSAATGDGDLDALTASEARLSGLLALMAPEETVTLSQAKAGQLVLTTDRMTAKLFTLPAEDFPGLPERRWTKRWSLAAGSLRALLDRTVHAISFEATRYYLNGVFLHVHGEGVERKFCAAATDGHRLMLACEDLPQGDEPLPLIFPRHLAHVLRGFLARCPPEHVVRVKSTDTILEFEGPSWTMIAKAIDGVFPDFRRVIPPELTGEPLKVLDTRRFADAIRTTRAISDEKSLPVRLGNGEGQAVTLDAKGGTDEDCSLALPRDVAEWGSNAAQPGRGHGFQARYLLDVCGVFRNGFDIRVGDGEPSRITGPEGLAILMPMRF